MGKAFVVLAAVVLVIFVVFWLRAGRPRPGSGRSSRPVRPSVLGPDDDPDFLRGLDTPPPLRDSDEEPPPK